MARINGTQEQDWYTSPVGVFLDGAFYQVVDAQNRASTLRGLGVPCELHRLSGPGLPLWTLRLLPLPEGQDTYPLLQEA
jgi:hypothetical protein